MHLTRTPWNLAELFREHQAALHQQEGRSCSERLPSVLWLGGGSGSGSSLSNRNLPRLLRGHRLISRRRVRLRSRRGSLIGQPWHGSVRCGLELDCRRVGLLGGHSVRVREPAPCGPDD